VCVFVHMLEIHVIVQFTCLKTILRRRESILLRESDFGFDLLCHHTASNSITTEMRTSDAQSR